MVAAIVAPAGDVDVCQCYFDRDFYQFTDTSRNFPVLGFIGDRVGRVRGGEKWGKSHAGIRTKTTLILDLVILDFRFQPHGANAFDFILNFTFYILNSLLWKYFQVLIHHFQL